MELEEEVLIKEVAPLYFEDPEGRPLYKEWVDSCPLNREGLSNHDLVAKKSFLWSFGNNSNKELGLQKTYGCNPVPRNPLGSQKNSIAISSGYQHSGMVSLEGKVYMCGNNLSQKLGLVDKTDNDKVRPFSEVNITQKPKAVTLACGFSHSMALLEDGTVVSWGGSLGQKRGNVSENALARHVPKPLVNFTYKNSYLETIPIKVKIKQIAAG